MIFVFVFFFLAKTKILKKSFQYNIAVAVIYTFFQKLIIFHMTKLLFRITELSVDVQVLLVKTTVAYNGIELSIAETKIGLFVCLLPQNKCRICEILWYNFGVWVRNKHTSLTMGFLKILRIYDHSTATNCLTFFFTFTDSWARLLVIKNVPDDWKVLQLRFKHFKFAAFKFSSFQNI